MSNRPDKQSACLDEATRVRLERLAARRGVRRDFYVVHHLPVGLDRQDYYAAYRARNPGYRCYVGYTMFETDRLPAGWADSLNQMDEIWVPSAFNRETFTRSGVAPDLIQVVPLGFDPAPFLDPPKPLALPGQRGFTFLSVFQWSKRKGGDLLLRAFLETFSPEEEVCLAIRSFGMKGESVARRVEQCILSLGRDPEDIPEIILLDDPVPEQDMPALYCAAHAFVLPSRGEGWGLPYMEAMASGLPVIGTNWSGNTAFMTEENSYLIPVDELVRVHAEEVAEMPCYEGHRYAEPSLPALKALMRRVFEERDEARARGAAAREDVLTRWTQGNTARIMAARFEAWQARWKAAALTRETPPREITWEGDFVEAGSTQEENRTFAKALEGEPDIHLMLKPMGEGEGRNPLPEGPFQELLCHGTARKPYARSIHVHQGDPTQCVRDRSHLAHVARASFGTDGLPPDWVPALNRFDEIWVPSGFNYRTFAQAGVDRDKLITVPGLVDAWRFGPHVDKLPLDPSGHFVFLSVLAWSMRKGWDLLVEAFCRAFSAREPVTLFLKVLPCPGMSLERIEEELAGFIRNRLHREPEACPRISVDHRIHAARDMPLLYRGADAFVLPFRGEGWGQALLEAMVTGLPTVGTGWSGPLDFMNEWNAYLVDYEKQPLPREALAELPGCEGHGWAEPSVPHLAELLREIFEDPKKARERGMQAREETAEKYAMERAARLVGERCEILANPLDPTLEPSSDRPRLVLEGGLFALSSTAYVNREAGRALLARDRLALATHALEGEKAYHPTEHKAYEALEKTRDRRFRKPAHVHVWHQWPPSRAVPSAGKWVIWQGWEYGSLPKKIAHLFKAGADEIWTYSTHCAREFHRDGIPAEKIQVIPLGVDPDRFHPIIDRLGEGPPGKDLPGEDRPGPGRPVLDPPGKDGAPPFRNLTDRSFVFLFVGGTIWRKGIDLLLSAFCEAFTRDDDVALLVKEMGSSSFYQDFNLSEAVERLSAFPEAPRIVLFEEMLSDEEMPGLYRSCHCLVHPYRGEGFGLPVLEAMACGIPVIATAGGACDDFLSPDRSLTLPADRREIALPLETVRPAWVLEPDREALVEQLRQVADDPEGARKQALAESERIRRDWTWDRTAAVMEARCQALRGAR